MSKTIPIKKLRDATGDFYPLCCSETVFTSSDIKVNNDIGGYTKGDIIPSITDNMSIWKKLFSEVPNKPTEEIIEEAYVHVDGTTFIDTGIIGKTGIKVEVKFSTENCRSGENPTRYPCLLGSCHNQKGIRFQPVGFWDGHIKVQYGNQYGAFQTYGAPLETPSTYICTIEKNGLIDAQGLDHLQNRYEFAKYDMNQDINNEVTMYLFATHLVDTKDDYSIPYNYWKGKLYYCKIWDTESGKLVRDFIPIDLSLLPSWNVESTYFKEFPYKCGLYDTVEKKIYVNTNNKMTCSNGCLKVSNLWGIINGENGVSYTQDINTK